MVPQSRFGARRWLLAAWVAASIAAAAAVWWHRDALQFSVIEAWVQSLGIWALVGYVVLYGLATVAMVPGSIFDTVGGALFGPLLGSVVNLIGGSLGAMLAFVVARHLAGDWVERRGGARLREIKHSVEAEGWRFVAMVRLVPVFPYTIFNYLLGLTRIPFWQYTATTVACMAPSTVAYTWLGHAGRHLANGGGGEQQIHYALLALGIAAVAVFLPSLIRRWRSGNGRPGSGQGPGQGPESGSGPGPGGNPP